MAALSRRANRGLRAKEVLQEREADQASLVVEVTTPRTRSQLSVLLDPEGREEARVRRVRQESPELQGLQEMM